MQIPALVVCLAGLAMVVQGATPPAPKAAPAPFKPVSQAGAKKASQPATAPASHRRASNAAGARPDAEIEAVIRAKLAKSKIAADKFTVRVQGGVAILEGQTDIAQHKGVATRMARSAGAAAVDNRIQVSEAARAKAAANLAKGRRRAQVKRTDARSEDRSQGTPR